MTRKPYTRPGIVEREAMGDSLRGVSGMLFKFSPTVIVFYGDDYWRDRKPHPMCREPEGYGGMVRRMLLQERVSKSDMDADGAGFIKRMIRRRKYQETMRKKRADAEGSTP